MRTRTCDMFLEQADALVITTNLFVKKNGEAVMGRGVARRAAYSWYGLTKLLGKLLSEEGKQLWLLTDTADSGLPYLSLPRKEKPLDVALPWHLVAFPVKHNWSDAADRRLIKRSCKQLLRLTDLMKWEKVLVPRPGCGNGGLRWKQDVRPILSKVLGDDRRFVIVNLKQESE